MTSLERPVEAPPAGHYRIEPRASEIAITAKHLFGLATVRAHVPIVSGELVVADDVGASHATVTASAAGFDSGDARRDRAVMAAKFLDVQKHPSLLFTLTAVSHEDGQWVAAGVLTAHGVQAPLRLLVSAAQSDVTGLTVHATGRVDRYEHKITAARGLAGRTIELRITARAALQA